MFTLSAKQITKWRDHFCVLSGVDFDLTAGEGLWIRGDNGAGKTSLLRILTGLSKADEGEIRFNTELIDNSDKNYRNFLHYISHQPTLIPHLNVFETVEMLFPLLGATAGSDIEMTLNDVGLQGMESQQVGTLSAGQKQRLSLSRLLFSNKPLWILDEPQSHLDASGRVWLQTLISKHLQGKGLAVIVSHAEQLPIANLRSLELSK